MQYRDLVAKMAAKTKYTHREVRMILRTLTQTIREEILQGRDVHFDGFGVFLNLPVGRKVGRHPVTGERIDIPPRRRLKFEPARRFKQKIKYSVPHFVGTESPTNYGLKEEEDDGKVRSRDRQGEGGEGEAGREGEQGGRPKRKRPSRPKTRNQALREASGGEEG